MRTASQLLVVVAVAVAMLPSHVAVAQAAPSFYISGTIVSGDTNLPGAIVSATSTATGKTFSTVSDDQGRYNLSLPAPGTYSVRVELFGFSPADRVLSVIDQASRADFRLALATGESSATNHRLPVPQYAAANDPRPKASRGEGDAKRSSALSADMPMDFSFAIGQVIQIVAADSAGGEARIRQSPVHGSFYYQAGNSALDASPYALHGITAEKPDYGRNSFGANLGGTLPWLRKGITSLFVNYSGNRSGNPYSGGLATVPTAALRAGDFSGLRMPYGPVAGQVVTIYDPTTGEPFVDNRIPLNRMSPAALGLLAYMPLPNSDGVSQNFRFVSATHTRSDGFGLRIAHGPSGLAHSGTHATVRNFNVSLGIQRSTMDLPNMSPLLGGNSTSGGWYAKLAYTLTKGFFTDVFRVGFDSTIFRTFNHFREDVAAGLGITGVSRDSFDWGLPSIDLTYFTGLRGVVPMLRANRNFSFADALSWSWGKHNLKWGGEFRRLGFDVRSNNDADGSFLFTGFATAQFVDGNPVPGTGSDFADFLLGLPQKTHVQYSNGALSFNGNAWSLYFVDDWRLAKNVSLNLGLRYEYVSPLSEAQNRLVTLDAPPDFSRIAVVRAGGVGPFTGQYPDTILAPNRYNFAPRLGIAWRAAERLILRAGYSISYDPSLYSSVATRLAVQPPFAVEQTGIATDRQALTLQNGFPTLTSDTISNNFAISRNLPLGYAQVWVLQVQRELPHGIALVTSYTGTKGSHLEMLRAPNRTPTGLLLANVEPFLWQTAEGSSILHAGSLRVQKRLEAGLSFGASYMFSRSIDDVPALGDGTPVPQDERNLKGERGLSAFDQRHRLTIDYAYEPPFGRGKRWLGTSAIGDRVLGGWSFTGTAGYGSGFPLTAHVLGDFADVTAGGYGSLRPDLTGQPMRLPQPTVDRFFNTSAFTLPPAGQYGNAGRNTLIGPSIFTMDAAMEKSFPVKEGHTLQFQMQASNLLNTPKFSQVDTNLNSSSYGQITGVDSMRVIQLGLRYSF